MEIPRVVVGLAGLQPAAGIAGPRVFDLHHLGAEPGEGLGAGRPGLELGEVHDANAFETIELDANAIARLSRCEKNRWSHYHSEPRPHHPERSGLITTGQILFVDGGVAIY